MHTLVKTGITMCVFASVVSCGDSLPTCGEVAERVYKRCKSEASRSDTPVTDKTICEGEYAGEILTCVDMAQ